MANPLCQSSLAHLRAKLPYPLNALATLAFNSWWSWSPEGLSIFQSIDPEQWEQCRHNPVKLLNNVHLQRLSELAKDPHYLQRVEVLTAQFQQYTQEFQTWGAQAVPQLTAQQPIAYFSIEYGLHSFLPTYAGGLGVLAGDHLKSASDLGVPLVGVGLLYRQGYFRQRLNGEGWQEDYYLESNFEELPLHLCRDGQGEVLTIEVQIRDRAVNAMGENLALNIERQGFSVSVYNRTAAKTDSFMAKRAAGKRIQATYSPQELVSSLERPRKILLMVKSGDPVDAVIDQLKPLLDPGDILVDGGNSFYEDTARRSCELQDLQLKFVGMGVSGGEIGALMGPSLMPGGDRSAYDALKPMLVKVAAQVEDGSCVTYLGPGSAGHYVKMVHNGIEYGMMQLIAEAYDLMSNGLGLSHKQLHQVFSEWNQRAELRSYLLEITADIFQHLEPDTGRPLVNLILDAAEQKGTGNWTVMSAMDLGVPVPTIMAAVNARIISAYKTERMQAAPVLKNPIQEYQGAPETLIQQLRDVLYCAQICAYAEGMTLLKVASQIRHYDLNLSEIARIWKGGCIIRAGCLREIQAILDQQPDIPNLLLTPQFYEAILSRQAAWRQVLAVAAQLDIPVPAHSASLAYFNSYRRDRLPQNLTQAQRDYFGSHTYERIDQGGTFHTEWTPIDEASLQTGTAD
jgi:6-phosphogluconate dehydrogenase